MLEVGAEAPDLEITTHDGVSGPLSRFWSSGPLILFFYPKNHTMICTRQNCAMQGSYSQFNRLGVNVLGSSEGSLEGHRAFAEAQNLAFPLVVDEDSKLARAFGVFRPLLGVAKRVTFMLDEQGMVVERIHAELSVDAHLKRARDFADRYGNRG